MGEFEDFLDSNIYLEKNFHVPSGARTCLCETVWVWNAVTTGCMPGASGWLFDIGQNICPNPRLAV
jgi:hypothetical protein